MVRDRRNHVGLRMAYLRTTEIHFNFHETFKPETRTCVCVRVCETECEIYRQISNAFLASPSLNFNYLRKAYGVVSPEQRREFARLAERVQYRLN